MNQKWRSVSSTLLKPLTGDDVIEEGKYILAEYAYTGEKGKAVYCIAHVTCIGEDRNAISESFLRKSTKMSRKFTNPRSQKFS